MSHFHSRLLIIFTCLLSLGCSALAQAEIAISISTPVPMLRAIIDPPAGYQGCYQIPPGFYNGVWTDGYQMCKYPNTVEEGMWVSPHWECDDFFGNVCRQWVWVPAYWNPDWDQEWNPAWVWVSLFWDHRWDPHWDRRWDSNWHGHWSSQWRGNWDPDWRAHHGRDWHGERDKHWSPRWEGHRDPNQSAPADARWFERKNQQREEGLNIRGGKQDESNNTRRFERGQNQDDVVIKRERKVSGQIDGKNNQREQKLSHPNNFRQHLKQASEKGGKEERRAGGGGREERFKNAGGGRNDDKNK